MTYFFHSKTPRYLVIEQTKLATLYQKLWSGDPCCCTYYWRFSHIFDQNFQSFLSNLEKNFKYFQLLSAEKQRKKGIVWIFQEKMLSSFLSFLFKLLLLICSQLLYLLKIHVRLGFFPLIWPVPVWRIDRKLGNLVEKCIWNIQF